MQFIHTVTMSVCGMYLDRAPNCSTASSILCYLTCTYHSVPDLITKCCVETSLSSPLLVMTASTTTLEEITCSRHESLQAGLGSRPPDHLCALLSRKCPPPPRLASRARITEDCAEACFTPSSSRASTYCVSYHSTPTCMDAAPSHSRDGLDCRATAPSSPHQSKDRSARMQATSFPSTIRSSSVKMLSGNSWAGHKTSLASIADLLSLYVPLCLYLYLCLHSIGM